MWPFTRRKRRLSGLSLIARFPDGPVSVNMDEWTFTQRPIFTQRSPARAHHWTMPVDDFGDPVENWRRSGEELDPDYEWDAFYEMGSYKPTYARGACRHRRVEPVMIGSACVGRICLVCDETLPGDGDWF